jgi:hypothetical protein
MQDSNLLSALLFVLDHIQHEIHARVKNEIRAKWLFESKDLDLRRDLQDDSKPQIPFLGCVALTRQGGV